MLTNIIKFIHLLLTLGLLGSTVFCIVLIGTKKLTSSRFYQSCKIILLLALLVAFTGTLLVHPRHFTFHTPWIQAAYLLIISFIISILLLMHVRKKQVEINHWPWQLAYCGLVILLITIIHDAVTKTTFLIH